MLVFKRIFGKGSVSLRKTEKRKRKPNSHRKPTEVLEISYDAPETRRDFVELSVQIDKIYFFL